MRHRKCQFSVHLYTVPAVSMHVRQRRPLSYDVQRRLDEKGSYRSPNSKTEKYVDILDKVNIYYTSIILFSRCVCIMLTVSKGVEWKF